METVSENPADLFPCRDCDEEFDTKEEAIQHWRDTHSAAARRARGEAPRAARGRPRGPRAAASVKSAPTMNSVRTLLTTGYALAGTGMVIASRARQDDRMAAVAQSVMMTAGPGGQSLDKLAKRVPPVYKMLQAAAGGAGVLEDAAPLAIPLMVGMYVYAPPLMQEMMRPMAATMLGIVLYQTFPYDEPPSMPGEMTPIALPKWIQEFAEGLLPRPEPRQAEPRPAPTPTVEQQPAA